MSDGEKTSRWKLALLVAVSCVVSLLLLEVGVRVIFSLRVGPEILFYGFSVQRDERSVAVHDYVVEGRYSKYHPGQVRLDTDATGETFEVVMNSRGFRGDDFPLEKGPEVTRVVTLGASSTFGYHSRDDDTYPHEMQQILNDRCAPRRFEVINLGIPHLSSDQILALFVDEALPLRPDVVTFYEGVNDSEGGTWRLPRRRSPAQQIRLLARKTFLTARLIRDVMRQEDLFTASDIQAEIAEKAPRFLANLEEIATLCGEHGISFVVATQQAKSSLLDRDEIRGVTYADEIQVIEEDLARDGELRWPEKNLLVHRGLMDALRGWARERGVPLVDVIEALDPRRDTLVSWVHLTPEGNRMIAEAFADSIAMRECR